MTDAEAEQTVRELVDRYGVAPFSMPDRDLERLQKAVEVLGQERVFGIAQDRKRRNAG